jgi:hypothetical protein
MKRILTLLAVGLTLTLALNAVAHDMKGAKEAKAVTIKGEVVDTGCYLSHGAKGADHKECATKCISGGMPMGLLTSDNKFYLLTLNHTNADPYNQLKDMASATVEVTGTTFTRNGVTMIDVTGVKAVN